MSDYPAGVYTPREKENAPGIVYDADQKSRLYVEDIIKLDDEVVAIETELGENPKGDDVDVVARLNRIDGDIDDLILFNEYKILSAHTAVNNSTVLTDCGELVVAVPANTTVHIRFFIVASIKASSDFKFSIIDTFGRATGGYFSGTFQINSPLVAFGTETDVLVTANQQRYGIVDVYVSTDIYSTNIKFQFAQKTAVAESTFVLKGSYAQVRRLT
jgi:hypothetical protein